VTVVIRSQSEGRLNLNQYIKELFMKTYQDFCDNIASKLFNLIEENGSLLKWKRNWSVNGSQSLPFSKSGLYHGGNLLTLLLAQVEKGFTKNKWITFNQTLQLDV
jgi:antirestriction protein ArdC